MSPRRRLQFSQDTVIHTVPSIEVVDHRWTAGLDQPRRVGVDRRRRDPDIPVTHREVHRRAPNRGMQPWNIDVVRDGAAPANQPGDRPELPHDPTGTGGDALRKAVDLEPRNAADQLGHDPVEVGLLVDEVVFAVLAGQPGRADPSVTHFLDVEAGEPLGGDEHPPRAFGRTEPVQDPLREHAIAVKDQPGLGGRLRIAGDADPRVTVDDQGAIRWRHLSPERLTHGSCGTEAGAEPNQLEPDVFKLQFLRLTLSGGS